MRALALHEDLIVVVSAVWQTTATLVRAGEEGFLIDSPVLPDELDALPSLAEQTGFPISGLIATHADWDHLLGRIAFPDAALAVGESSAERLASEMGGAQRRLREFDGEWYVEGRRPLGLAGAQALPVPGRLTLGSPDPGGAGGAGGAGGVGGEREIELYPADGHTADGMALWMPWLGVLVCGDYLSPVEIPMISEGGSVDAYLATVARLAPLVERAETVVPGHGAPQGRDGALRILEEDVAYLEALGASDGSGGEGAAAALPAARRSTRQRAVHAANVERLAS